MNKKKISFTVLMVATTVMTWCGFTFAADKEPVKIGLVTSISGPFSPYGVEIQRAILFAVKQANQEGGVDGRKVEVMQADDESTPEGARRGAEKVSRAGHNLIIGPISTPMSLSIAQKLESWDALYIAVTAKS
ncbi:MAG: ABC transporter substrate-binding protein, partial [Desulfuromonadaceae bacterium]